MRVSAFVLILCGFLVSCTRSDRNGALPLNAQVQPIAVLKAGEYPLWFQLGPQGPALLNSIDEACYSRALIPWPLTEHVRFILAQSDDVFFAVNCSGFLMFSPWNETAGGGETALYYFPGGDLWQSATIAAFVFYNDSPAALLYSDDRFINTRSPLPDPRVWTFNRETPVPFGLDIPAFNNFSASEGWDVDALRYSIVYPAALAAASESSSPDGFWYYRVIKKDSQVNNIIYMRSASLGAEGETINSGQFYNSALPAPLSAVPPVLAPLLKNTHGAVMVVSPEFISQRYFARPTDDTISAYVYYRDASRAALLIDSQGRGFRTAATETEEYFPLALPQLPENFAYTGIALCGQTIVAVWEEQEEYNIGAAGFMVLRLP